MEIYIVLEDEQPIMASENHKRISRWIKEYAERTYAENYGDADEGEEDEEDEDAPRLNIGDLEAEIEDGGEAVWSITTMTLPCI